MQALQLHGERVVLLRELCNSFCDSTLNIRGEAEQGCKSCHSHWTWQRRGQAVVQGLRESAQQRLVDFARPQACTPSPFKEPITHSERRLEMRPSATRFFAWEAADGLAAMARSSEEPLLASTGSPLTTGIVASGGGFNVERTATVSVEGVCSLS